MISKTVHMLVLVLAGTVACSSSADDSTANATGDASPGAIPPAGTPDGSAPGGDAGAPLTGDVWVDADGKELGLARTLPDARDNAQQALIDAMGIAWRVEADRGAIGAFDSRGTFLFSNADCTGTRWVGSLGNLGLPAPGSSTEVGGYSNELFAIKVGSKTKSVSGYGSYWSAANGCLSGAQLPSTTVAYEDVDVRVVAPLRGFKAPLHVERR